MKTRFAILGIILLILALGLPGWRLGFNSTATLTPITVQLSWFHQNVRDESKYRKKTAMHSKLSLGYILVRILPAALLLAGRKPRRAHKANMARASGLRWQ